MKINIIFIVIGYEIYHMISDVSSHWWLVAPTITRFMAVVTSGLLLPPMGVCIFTDDRPMSQWSLVACY